MEDIVSPTTDDGLASSSLHKTNQIPTSESRRPKKRRSSHDGDDIADSSGCGQSEPPCTPRRTSKRKRTTRNRPDLVPPHIDLEAILNEPDNPVAPESIRRPDPPASSRKSMMSATATARGNADLRPTTPIHHDPPSQTTVRASHSRTGADEANVTVEKGRYDHDTNQFKGVHHTLSKIANHPVKEPSPSNSSKPPASSKPLVGVRFWIIKARLPRLVCEKWMDGKIQGKSLESVMEAVSNVAQSTRIKELRFTLQTADQERTYTIPSDAVNEFEEMKRQFNSDITVAFRKNRNELQDFEIWIEPIDREDCAKDGEAEVEDAEIGDW